RTRAGVRRTSACSAPAKCGRRKSTTATGNGWPRCTARNPRSHRPVADQRLAVPGVPGYRLAKDRQRVVHAEGLLHDYALALELFVVEEEATQLQQPVGRQILDTAVGIVVRVIDVDGDDLVVLALLVAHAHHPDGAGPHEHLRRHVL